MKKVDFLNSSCRHCRFYRPEGRRGGVCQKLSVPVDSNWKACSLASSPFTNSFKSLEEIIHLEAAFHLKYANQTSLEVNPKPQESVSKSVGKSVGKIVGTTTNQVL